MTIVDIVISDLSEELKVEKEKNKKLQHELNEINKSTVFGNKINEYTDEALVDK